MPIAVFFWLMHFKVNWQQVIYSTKFKTHSYRTVASQILRVAIQNVCLLECLSIDLLKKAVVAENKWSILMLKMAKYK